ncbi:MAG: proline dehydrogenase family protein [Elusimicrobiota bacterium]
MRALTFLAGRFVAGDTAAEAMRAVRALNERGLKATLDYLGEDCASEAQADAAAGEYVQLLRRIAEAGLDCNVSLKLTQFGLNLDAGLARRNLLRVVEEAHARRNFVRIDMEGSAYTQRTLDLFHDVFEAHNNVGVVIQAALKRSRADVARMNRAGARVRLCKGAYREPAEVAFQEKEEVNESFDRLAAELLENGNYPGLATHDEDRIRAAIRFSRKKGIPPDRFEFQMLYGLRPKWWGELAASGFVVRVYVPYGTHWLPYFMRRLRERKENWMFVLKNLARGWTSIRPENNS